MNRGNGEEGSGMTEPAYYLWDRNRRTPRVVRFPTETHPFIDSPYGPDRCRDCDHPESSHPRPPEVSDE